MLKTVTSISDTKQNLPLLKPSIQVETYWERKKEGKKERRKERKKNADKNKNMRLSKFVGYALL